MKYAICNEVYQDWPIEKAFSHARDLGYTGVEIAPFTIDPDVRMIDASTRQSVVRNAKDAGLEVVGLHWLLAQTEGFHLTTDRSEIRDATAQYLRDLAQLCADLGGSIMVFGSPQQRNRDEKTTRQLANERAGEVIRKVIPTLEQLGVTLALEPLGPEEGNYLLTADETSQLIAEIGSPQVRLHLDVKAMSSETKPIPQIIRENAEQTIHFHANDPNRKGPGMGDVDFVPVFQALRDSKYDGWISVEVFDYSPGIDSLVGDSIRYMQKVESMLDPA